MKGLGEEYNKIIIQELIPSSAFGNSLCLFSLYPFWGTFDCTSRCKTFLQEQTSGSWFPAHPLGLSEFTSSQDYYLLSSFFPTAGAEALLHTWSVVIILSPWSMMWVRRSWSINFKDSIFCFFSCPILDISDSFLAPQKTYLSRLESDTLQLFILRMRQMFLACDSIVWRVGPHWSLIIALILSLICFSQPFLSSDSSTIKWL